MHGMTRKMDFGCVQIISTGDTKMVSFLGHKSFVGIMKYSYITVFQKRKPFFYIPVHILVIAFKKSFFQ
ncbi:unnamed protein product [Haemonchus placei]|uniref:Uncharacterized protein n=1 Tax=Haemonchus placei TaxID=6290 RepID=A0A3P7XMP7_HAEPC|nr:unnamed protein product [Haemonchus placei]